MAEAILIFFGIVSGFGLIAVQLNYIAQILERK